MAHAKDYATENPAFLRNPAGVAANHSTTVRSTSDEFDHAQSDDDLQDIVPPQDPNLSGKTPTEATYTWQAGPLSAWQENDDYRQFLEADEVAESVTTHRYRSVHDFDYDDNGGVALGLGHTSGRVGPVEAPVRAGDLPTADEFPVGPVIRRRL